MIEKIDVSIISLWIGAVALTLHPLWVELVTSLGWQAGLVDNIIILSFLLGIFLLAEAKTGRSFLKESILDFVEMMKE